MTTALLAAAIFLDALCLFAWVWLVRRSEPMPASVEPEPAYVAELAAQEPPSRRRLRLRL